jgi:AraC-like DNA-binding protein/ActR/RegA family two-component response regulator
LAAPVRRTVATAPDPARPRLLWIDDEISGSDVQVHFLELQGFRVDCAFTGSDGLAMARASGYDGILLDLKLPDLPGLAVLATLRGENITTPVLVLTGFADFESANVAGRLGAQFKAKPLFIDDLEVAVRRLIEERSPGLGSLSPHAPSHQLRAGLGGLARLLEVLHGAKAIEHGPGARRILMAVMIRSLANPTLPMAVFLACAAALRRVAARDEGESVHELASESESLILETLGRPDPRNPKVVSALEMVHSAAAQHKRLEIEHIAECQGIDDGHLSRLIRNETGFRFTHWRTAVLLRPSLAPLADTDERIKQICHQLGYKHEAQFDRDFHEFFGVTPTQFRQICRQRE